MSTKFLYRRLGSAVIVVALLVAASPRSFAQGRPELKRPEQGPEEKPPEPKKKKVKGPRAVGILQFGSGKTTLIPVAILVDGKFYDASAYKADPVPMALESGTVYEAEQAGDSQGLFTVNGALHSKSAGSQNPWVGTGSYLPQGAEAPKTTRKAEDVPVGLDNSGDEPPRLTRKTSSTSNSSPTSNSGTSPAAEPSQKPGTNEAPANGSSAGGSSEADKPKSEPKPADNTADQNKTGDMGANKQSPATTAAGQTPPGQPTAGQASPAPSSTEQASQGQAAQAQQTENYYRPTLRRGKPTQPAPQEDEPTPKVASPGSPANASDSAAGGGTVRLVPAISDASGPDPRPYKVFWKEGEEDERRKQMLALARDEVRAYTTALAKNRISAKPPGAKETVAGHKTEAKGAQPLLDNVQFHAFDVWANNQPVMILSAEAHFPAAPASVTAPELYNVTIVAKTDIYGNLRKLYSGVTDEFHLDVTPRLELIDAVDADGDGRGELLFRETTDAGSGYVIYRATADKLWKMFDSLGAEYKF